MQFNFEACFVRCLYSANYEHVQIHFDIIDSPSSLVEFLKENEKIKTSINRSIYLLEYS